MSIFLKALSKTIRSSFFVLFWIVVLGSIAYVGIWFNPLIGLGYMLALLFIANVFANYEEELKYRKHQGDTFDVDGAKSLRKLQEKVLQNMKNSGK